MAKKLRKRLGLQRRPGAASAQEMEAPPYAREMVRAGLRRPTAPLPARPRANAMAKTDPLSKFGWIGPILSLMANNRRWINSINPSNQVIMSTGYPLLMLHSTPGDVLNAARLAVQGHASKVIAQSVWAAADNTLTLTGSVVFGVRIRVSNAITTFKFAAVNVQVLNGATVIADFYVQVNQLPLDVIVFTTSNANGLASIVPVTNPIVKFLLATNPTLATGDALYAESLNMRDIGDIPNAEAACALGDVGDPSYGDGYET
jgi:hypothetical protein